MSREERDLEPIEARAAERLRELLPGGLPLEPLWTTRRPFPKEPQAIALFGFEPAGAFQVGIVPGRAAPWHPLWTLIGVDRLWGRR